MRPGILVTLVLALVGVAAIAAAEPAGAAAGWCDATGIGQPQRAADTRRSVRTVASQDPADTGTIRGRLVSCAGSLPGARVSVEGHPHLAISGPAGLFVLSHVPPGTVDVTIETPNQPRATIAGIRVSAGGVTDVGEVSLDDLTTDPAHCGACTTRCPGGAACVFSVCICPDGLLRCGDECVTLADLEHCRACDNRCPAWPNIIPACGAQDCIFSCVAGTADCDSRWTTGCETRIDSDAHNCGGCGTVCAPGQRCVNFTCQ